MVSVVGSLLLTQLVYTRNRDPKPPCHSLSVEAFSSSRTLYQKCFLPNSLGSVQQANPLCFRMLDDACAAAIDRSLHNLKSYASCIFQHTLDPGGAARSHKWELSRAIQL